ncbi:hypothetical protein AB4027_06340 [Alkalibacterium putridalgicola]|uniref:hypothetical protein n=1 Tax=Alkalibacterium putridalgicola TaxID=426703 RepID=UPI0034CE367F
MSIINTDIIIRGKHASIVNYLIDNNVYKEGYEVFIDACLLGIYHGTRSQMDTSSNDKVEISRTIWGKRADLENSLFVFLQHEKVLKNQPIETAEVFNMSLNSIDTRELLQELKEYAYYGIELLNKDYTGLDSGFSIDNLIQYAEDNLLETEEDIKLNVDQHLSEIKTDIDDQEEVESILNSVNNIGGS